MPHVILEYTNNLKDEINLEQIFSRFHQSIIDTLPVSIDVCRSRAIKHGKYYIGDGDKKNAHMHICLSVLEGHDENLLQKLGDLMLQILKEQCSNTLDKKIKLQTTCEIKEIRRPLYFK